MLPAVSNLKAKTVAALTALAIALPAAPALAWGDREQGVLTGIAGTLLVESLIRNGHHRPQVVQPPPPIYVQPEPGHHHRHPHYDRVITLSQTAAARAFNSYSRGERRLIQRRLAQAGYYYGGIDGSFGRGTYQAVAAYAQDNGQSLGNTGAAFAVYDGLLY